MMQTRPQKPGKEAEGKALLEMYSCFPKVLDENVLLMLLTRAVEPPVGKDDVVKIPNNKVL